MQRKEKGREKTSQMIISKYIIVFLDGEMFKSINSLKQVWYRTHQRKYDWNDNKISFKK